MKPTGPLGFFRWHRIVIIILLLARGAVPVLSQESLNRYYRYPFSVGISYQPLSSLALVDRKAAINELSVHARLPLPFLPILQPFLFGGLISADSDEKDDPTVLGGTLDDGVTMPDYNQDDVWDHRYWFGALGAGYSHRISKEFEVGADVFFGLGVSSFQNRVVTAAGEWYPVGELGFITGASGKLALNPSFNLSIRITPSLRYSRSLGNLHDFDGLYFGVGFSAHYRFGKDPDAPEREIRSIRFSDVSIPSLFAAMQSYYAKNPVGTVTITNTDDRKIEDVKLFFFQAGFMDSPTPAETIETLGPGEAAEVPLFASFNREVFSVEGITPLTGEVIVSYTSSGRPAEQKQPVSYDLHDKTSMTWDDDKKAAAFITPADSALRNYTSFIRQACKEETVPLYNSSLQFSMQAFHALSELGILYQADPTLPFTEVQENTVVVDSISLPRDTLKRITGDCDDLTVLYCSLLETVGIETGFITVPGHIYAVFNTKEEATQYKKIHADRNMTINVDGELWVPVEITMIGRTGFLEAWRKGAEEWNAYGETPKKRGFYITRNAQEIYRPVGLRETDLGLQYGEREDIIEGFNNDMDRLITQVVKEYVRAAEEGGRARDWNKLGIVYAQFMRYGQADRAFSKALRTDRNYVGAMINRANVLFLQEEYEQALNAYEEALAAIEERQQGGTARGTSHLMKLLLNISRTYYQLTRYDRAQEYFARAEELDPASVEEYSYLASAGGAAGTEDREGETARAAEDRDVRWGVLFVEGEEQ